MPSVLIVDDERAIRVLLRTWLEEWGYEVLEATNGKDCLARYEQTPTDVIVLDIFMPEQDGLETMMKLYGQFHQVKILVITGGRWGPYPDVVKAATLIGKCHVLEKPFDMETFRKALQKLVDTEPVRHAAKIV